MRLTQWMWGSMYFIFFRTPGVSPARPTRDVLAYMLEHARIDDWLDTVPDAMVVIDEQGTMISFSAAAERLFQIGIFNPQLGGDPACFGQLHEHRAGAVRHHAPGHAHSRGNGHC